MVYIDLAGIVGHPSECASSGYSEIQQPRRKSSLIAYERLRVLAGFNSYGEFQVSHRNWVASVELLSSFVFEV